MHSESDFDLQAALGVSRGELFESKYRVERLLGRGGMGLVVLAHHVKLDEAVAIKVIRPELVDAADVLARFEREARAVARIRSVHVARVLDFGTRASGAPYIVMEYLEGTDLATWLARSGPPSIERAVELMLHACDALAESHAQEIVHRDLKPANLFVVAERAAPFLKVLDFGVSRFADAAGDACRMTRTSMHLGSPLYMSPEQMHSAKDADARSDLWSLGVIFHELLTGEHPFHADTLAGTLSKVDAGFAPPIRDRRPDVSPHLESIILKCLEKSPEARWQHVTELAHALAAYAPTRAIPCLERIALHGRAGRFARPADVGAPTGADPRSTVREPPPNGALPRDPVGGATVAAVPTRTLFEQVWPEAGQETGMRPSHADVMPMSATTPPRARTGRADWQKLAVVAALLGASAALVSIVTVRSAATPGLSQSALSALSSHLESALPALRASQPRALEPPTPPATAKPPAATKPPPRRPAREPRAHSRDWDPWDLGY